MPKGHKLVDWAQSGNDTKLLLSIVKTHGIDYDKVAAEFGAPKNAITSRIYTLRKNAGGNVAPKAAALGSRAGVAKPKPGTRKRKVRRYEEESEDMGDSENETGSSHLQNHPSMEKGSVTKTVEECIDEPRSLLRKSPKVNYKRLENQYGDSGDNKPEIKCDGVQDAKSEDEDEAIAREVPSPGIKLEEHDMGI